VKLIIALLFLSVIQVTVVPLIAIGSVIPDLLIILIVMFSLKFGQFYGTFFGTITGLFFDFVSGGILGSAMFAKTISGFLAGFFFNENKIEYNTATLFLSLIVFLISTVDSFFYLLMTSSEIKLTASHLFLQQGVLPGIYTSLLSIPIVIYNQRRKD
jgi:rod shape-determining protein MreD